MTKRVLIVVSSYAPAMIADMHRARHLAWSLPRVGWSVEILTPDSDYQAKQCLDADSAGFFPLDTSVHRVPLRCRTAFSGLRLRSIGWRALVPMYIAGRRLLESQRFDLVYISTTQFPLFLLGVVWRHRAGVPYVLDVHDPCYREVAGTPMWASPSLKHSIANWVSRWIEYISVRSASGIVAVSPAYIEMFHKRYSAKGLAWATQQCYAAIPFGVRAEDFDEACREWPNGNPEGLPNGTTSRIVYVGAGGPIMRRSFGMLCRTLAAVRAKWPELMNGVSIELRGTHFGWRNGDPCHLAEIAKMEGIADLVHERPYRVTYRESLELLMDAQGALILGVEDDGYMPSKMFSYAWSGKPLLAVLRRRSPAFDFARKHSTSIHAIWFDENDEMPEHDAVEAVRSYLLAVQKRRTYERNTEIKPYTALAMARRHAELFDACLSNMQAPVLRQL